jgi:hypothetical protein
MAKKTTTSSVTNKTFNFERGEKATLSFTLNIEDVKGMRDFKEILQSAIVAVDGEIENTLGTLNRAMKRLQGKK